MKLQEDEEAALEEHFMQIKDVYIKRYTHKTGTFRVVRHTYGTVRTIVKSYISLLSLEGPYQFDTNWEKLLGYKDSRLLKSSRVDSILDAGNEVVEYCRFECV